MSAFQDQVQVLRVLGAEISKTTLVGMGMQISFMNAISKNRFIFFEQAQTRWLLYFTLLLGVFQWLLWVTGYSWDSTFAQYVFPPMIGIVGLETWLRLRKQRPDAVLWSLPAMLAGLSVLVVGLVSAIPLLLFPVAILFVPFALVDGEVVGNAISPDGGKQAVAHYRADVAISPDSGESGQVTVSVKYRWLPMFRQDIQTYWADDKERSTPLVWQGDTLMIGEDAVAVKAVNWRLPSPFQDYGNKHHANH